MSKLLELGFGTSISGASNGTTYNVVNSSGTNVSTTSQQLVFGATAEPSNYGSVDLNSFHDTNRAFTIEFTVTDTNTTTTTTLPYNYIAIGKKSYSAINDVITVGVNESKQVTIGVISHTSSTKVTPTVPIATPIVKQTFQLNYDPNQSIRKRITLYKIDGSNSQLIAELGASFDDKMVNILDCVLYLGTSGTTNETGYDNKLDLTKNVTLHDKVSIYSGTTMDPLTTYFYHSTFSNLAHPVGDVCNNKSTEVIFTKFKTDNDLVDENDISVKLTNAHNNAYENVGEYVSKDNDTLEFAFKFSNLEKITTTNTFLNYEVSYLNKTYTIDQSKQPSNKMYIDSFTPTLAYKISDIGSNYVEFKIDSITDGTFGADTSQTDFTNYNVTFTAKNESDNEVASTESINHPTLNTAYRVTGLVDGVYYNVSAVITDPAKNASTSIVPTEITSGMRHYTNTKIRTTDVTAPSPFTIAQASSSGTGFAFSVTGISDNAIVDTNNPLDLFYLLTSTRYTDDAALKTAVETSGTKQTFTTSTASFDVSQTTTLTDGITAIEADKNYYFYAILKDADSNITIGKNSSDNKFVQFKVENSLSFTSMVSNYSINTIASETNTLTIKFTTTYPVLVSDNFSMVINDVNANPISITADDSTKTKWTITYLLSSNSSNENYHGYITGNVKLNITSTDNTTVERNIVLPNVVMLRGSSVTRGLGPYTSVFTNIAPNSITTTNHLTTVALKANDKIIDVSGLDKYDVELYKKSDGSLIETKAFTVFGDITPTITFENLTEGETYYADAVVTNDLGQTYTIRLQNDIITDSVLPEITSTGVTTSDTIMNDKPSIEITGLAVNDVNSSYDVYITALQSSIPASLTSEDIKTFFDNSSNTKRFADVIKNTVTNIVDSRASMTNTDGVFDVSGSTPKIVKAYDYSSKTVSDIAIDTTKLVLIGMVIDKSVDNNFITFQKTHNYTYDISNIAFENVKNPSSKFVTTGDVVNMTFTTNYAVSVGKLSSTFYGATQSPTSSDGGVNWTVGLTIPSSASDQSLIRNNTTLSITVDVTRSKTLSSDIQVDKSPPVWNFNSVIAPPDDNTIINTKIELTNDTANTEPMRFLLEASNDGTTATAEDAGKTYITTDTILTFGGQPITKDVQLTGLSPGLDYQIKGSLWDANSNLTTVIFSGNNGKVFTTDSILPVIVQNPSVYPDLAQVRVEGLQVKDVNSIYGYIVAITEPANTFTYEQYKTMSSTEGKDVFLEEDIPRGTVSTFASRVFTKYIKSDGTEAAIESGSPYKVVVIVKDVQGVNKLHEELFITNYPTITSDVVDTSGAGGNLTHYFTYDSKSLVNSLGSPHGLVSGLGGVSYVDGFVGSNAVFLNSNDTNDDHAIKVSSESMSNHTEFSFATWLKSYDTPGSTDLKTLFYYDNDHYLKIMDGTIESKWGTGVAQSSTPPMEFSSNDWNHIAMTVNPFDTDSASTSNVVIYWNSSNINVGRTGVSQSLSSSVTEFYIGGESATGTTKNFKGILDDTRIYNSIITADDVGLLFGSGGNALEITFDEAGNLVFTNDSGTLTEEQVTALLDPTDTATGDASITFDGDTTLELSGTQLDGIETTTDGVITESTVSFWIKPTADTFAQENTIIEYFASIGYTVTILPNGTLQFDLVENS